MTREDQAHLAPAAALTALAGCVDAIGFLKLGGLFVSFMSGDSTRFTVAAVQSDWSRSGTTAAVVAVFVLGVILGRLVWRIGGARRRALALAAVAAIAPELRVGPAE